MNHLISVLILLLPLILGFLSTTLVPKIKPSYSRLSPPPFVFGIIWTILYLCLGISSYLIYSIKKSLFNSTMILYWIHLLLLTLWYPLYVLFPKLKFIWFLYILFLWVYALYIAIQFYKISKVSAYLLIPYLIWLLCASYLCYYS